jgi:hypothetical protein
MLPSKEAPVIYGSMPSRLVDKTDEIMEFVAKMGRACLHPFKALPYKYYEGGVVGRDKTIRVCCKLIHVCDEFGIFGISEGTLIELEHHLEINPDRLRPQPLLVFIKEFDPEWRIYREKFVERFPAAIEVLDRSRKICRKISCSNRSA